jgi:hypothetical protein
MDGNGEIDRSSLKLYGRDGLYRVLVDVDHDGVIEGVERFLRDWRGLTTHFVSWNLANDSMSTIVESSIYNGEGERLRVERDEDGDGILDVVWLYRWNDGKMVSFDIDSWNDGVPDVCYRYRYEGDRLAAVLIGCDSRDVRLVTYSYNSEGLVVIEATRYGDTVLEELQYHYDGNGRLIRREYSHGGVLRTVHFRYRCS